MNLLWSYFWPVAALGVACGVISSSIVFRRNKPVAVLTGLVLAMAGLTLWHGPLGAADRLTAQIERSARSGLDHYEMTNVDARLQRGPLSRTLKLSGGQLDEWQRGELVRLMSQLPGVRSATWSERRGTPLIVEAIGAALAGFILGVLVAYALALRRRYNAEWKW